jgi:hypothetical protein
MAASAAKGTHMKARQARRAIGACEAALAVTLLCAAAVGSATCASAGTYGDTSPSDHEAGTRPLDPLTARERDAAQRVALEDSRVREVLADAPHRVVSVEFAADKGPSNEIVRGAEVLFYRPDRDVGVRAVVRLEPLSVVAVASVPGPQVPLTNDDYQSARQLALRHQLVQSRFGAAAERAQIEMLRELPTNPDDPCFRHRCVLLLFRLPEGYAAGPRVVVDLTAGEVLIRGGER